MIIHIITRISGDSHTTLKMAAGPLPSDVDIFNYFMNDKNILLSLIKNETINHKMLMNNFFHNDSIMYNFYYNKTILDYLLTDPDLFDKVVEHLDKPVVDPEDHRKSPMEPDVVMTEADDPFKNPGTCVVCLEQKCELVLVSCHHVNMCAGCYNETLRIANNYHRINPNCPTCRAPITSVMRFHEYNAQSDKDKKTVYLVGGE